MNSNTPIAAPVATPSARDKWVQTYNKTEGSFYTFMTKPSPERDDFLRSLSMELIIREEAALPVYSC